MTAIETLYYGLIEELILELHCCGMKETSAYFADRFRQINKKLEVK